jgi:hypothetical protein
MLEQRIDPSKINHAALAAEQAQLVQDADERSAANKQTNDPALRATAQEIFTALRQGGMPDAAATPLAWRIASLERNGMSLETYQLLKRLEGRIADLERELTAVRGRAPHLAGVEKR